MEEALVPGTAIADFVAMDSVASFPEAAAPDEIEDVRPIEVRLVDKNWKPRQGAYSFVEKSVKENGAAEANKYIEFLGPITSDSNSNALDAGIDCALCIVDVADPKLMSTVLDTVVKNVIEKCFSARPATQAKGKQLIHKVMEVSDPHSATALLIEKFGDRRPKVPPLCLETIIEGVGLFGATPFPLKDLLKALPPVFNSSNSQARDNAMSLANCLLRWLGSAPFLSMLENLRPAQRSELEKTIAELPQLEKPVPSLFLRKDVASGAAAAAVRDTQQSSRAAASLDLVDEVDLSKKLKSSDYLDLLKSEKWQEQSQGLQVIIDAIGPTPKLKPWPSSADIAKMCKEFLQTGHLLVQSKALKLLMLFSLGLRNKFSVEARTTMPFILLKAKEKKVVDDVEETSIVLFKYSVGFDPFVEDIAENVKSKKSPAHAKTCLLNIVRAIYTSEATVQPDSTRQIVDACVVCSDDSDPKVREATTATLATLYSVSQQNPTAHRELCSALNAIRSTNAKLYAKLTSPDTLKPAATATSDAPKQVSTAKPAATKAVSKVGSSASLPSAAAAKASAAPSVSEKSGPAKKVAAKVSKEERLIDTYPLNFSLSEALSYSIEQAQAAVQQFLAEDADAFTSAFGDAKWQSKVEALGTLTRRAGEWAAESDALVGVLVFVNAGTSNMRVNNMNITKALLELCVALAGKLSAEHRVVFLAMIDTFAEKFSDKKLQPVVEGLLDRVVTSAGLNLALDRVNAVMDTIKAPAAHVSYLAWAKSAVHSVGIGGVSIDALLRFLAKELENKQGSVRSGAIEVIAEVYHQAGPPLFAILNQLGIAAPTRAAVDAECQKVGFDPTVAAAKSAQPGSSSAGALPRVDLAAAVDKNIVAEMSTVEGKDSWQLRKAAIEKVVAACNASGCYVEYNRFLVEVMKALKLRLLDTQSNIRPVALAAIAKLVVCVDDESAVKLIKLSIGAVLVCVSDSKKAIKDSAIAVLEALVAHSDATKRTFFSAMIPSVAEWLPTAAARGELLVWLNDHLDVLSADCVELLPALVASLQDKNASARASAESIVSFALQSGFVSLAAIDKSIRDLPAASRKFIQPALDRLNAVEAAPSVPAVSAPVPASAAPSAPRATEAVRAAETAASVSESVQPMRAEDANAELAQDGDAEVVQWPALQVSDKGPRIRAFLESRGGLVPSSAADIDAELADLQREWLGAFQGTSFVAGVLFGNVSAADGFALLTGLVNQEARFMCQSDFVFRWIGLQLAVDKTSSECERLLEFLTQFMDSLRSLPRSVKLQLDSAEVSLYLPHFLSVCRSLSDHQRQNCNAILNCTSDCFPASAIAEHLLHGIQAGAVDCRRICLNELLRLIESVGFSALGRQGSRLLLQQLSAVSKSDPMYPFYQKLCVELMESVNYDEARLQEFCGDACDLSVLNRFLKGSSAEAAVTFVSYSFESLDGMIRDLLLLSDARRCDDAVLGDLVSHSERADLLVEGALAAGPQVPAAALQSLTTLLDRAVSLESFPQLSLPGTVLITSVVALTRAFSHAAQPQLDARSLHKVLADLLEVYRKLRGCSAELRDVKLAVGTIILSLCLDCNVLVVLECLVALFAVASWHRNSILRLMKRLVQRPSHRLSPHEKSLDGLVLIVERCERLLHGSSIVAVSTIEASTLMTRLVYRVLRDVFGSTILQEVLEQHGPATRHLLAQEAAEGMLENVPPSSNDMQSVEGKVSALVNQISENRDKAQPIRELFALKQATPLLDLDKYLDKLSSTFRRFVLDELSKLESSQDCTLEKPAVDEATGETTEILRIIESLKTAPPVVAEALESEEAEASLGSSLRLQRLGSRNLSTSSPFTRRNDKIRDSLSILTKSLELPNFESATAGAEPLERRLSFLKEEMTEGKTE